MKRGRITGKIVLKSPEINSYELLNQAVKFDRLYYDVLKNRSRKHRNLEQV